MKAFVIFGAVFVAFITAQAQDTTDSALQVQQTASSADQFSETTKAPVKYIDYSSLKKFTRPPILQSSSSGSQEQTIQVPIPTRADPRATKAPTPAPTLAPTPTPTPDPGPWTTITIDHDQVKPFVQPQPVTISEKAAIKFKPQLHITNGCHSYPAVDEAGQTSGGLKTKGAPSAGCKGSGWGSQVYGRSGWYQDVWAIMFCWYFPKDEPSSGIGHRHDWEHVIVWIDNPAVDSPKILAVTPSAHSGYHKYAPPNPATIDGNSTKVAYESKWPMDHALDSTTDGGDFQDLIMWDQLSENARRALNSVNFGSANTPMNDGNFQPKLGRAWPF
ncbi:Necrosis inducing protein NPP1 [Phytophthora megakarya]|uniref:Necrosis inducing protein NPP1 n=1 Tax=Phytophthora megakarya TaxID=4795 RepID=A0A225VTD9_9STRA|nr:Necrosis inducing protein NPP1 [Phytophthora megakarya]